MRLIGAVARLEGAIVLFSVVFILHVITTELFLVLGYL